MPRLTTGHVVVGVVGGSTFLPCNITPPAGGDKVGGLSCGGGSGGYGVCSFVVWALVCLREG